MLLKTGSLPWLGLTELLLAGGLALLAVQVARSTGPMLPAAAFSAVPADGFMEIEAIPVAATSRAFGFALQNTKSFEDGRWSGDAHMLAVGTQTGDWMEWTVPVAKAGRFRIEAYLTKSWDYGIVALTVPGRSEKAVDVNLFSAAGAVVPTGAVGLGEFELSPPSVRLRLEVVGRDPHNAAPHYQFGVDGVRLVPL